MFDAQKHTDKIINFIRDYYQKYNLAGAVLGISGGKDSAVVAALLVKALGKENVIGLTLPCHSKESDMVDAKRISDYYGFKLHNIDLTNTFDTFKLEVNKIANYQEKDLENSDINAKPRLRMMACYYMAALMSAINKKGYLVVGTSNKSELYVGYFTKGGDSVHDIAPIADLTVSEVIKVGEVLNVPKDILYKTPSDGLSNLSDEDKLGVTYDDIEKYLNNSNDLSKKTSEKIADLHNKSTHKFNIPKYEKDSK